MYEHPPLTQRVVSEKVHSNHNDRNVLIERPAYYKDYNEISLQKAMAAVDRGESLRRTAEKFGVPRSTLHDHIVGKVKLGAMSGPSPYLTRDGEEELANIVVRCSEIGYAYSRLQVLALVQQVGKGY